MIQFARENQGWGYRRMVGALSNLGYKISHQTVANILRRQGLSPAPERQTKTKWRDFIRSHMEVLAAVDFFTAEIWTAGGLMTYYVLTFMRVATRQVCIAGITTSPDCAWMQQMARNLTMAEFAVWAAGKHLHNYREAIAATASAGGDVDTNCAIVGGIVALSSGWKNIPNEWLQGMEPLPYPRKSGFA